MPVRKPDFSAWRPALAHACAALGSELSNQVQQELSWKSHQS